ncbi:MAG: dephospho-CoA kinase [Sideroxyarcus sp.]|nr:dephospho-CoA kinase [Sideroxyarcus sp.]HAF46026.1 dephospho-CoA kinase [Gallionellaceae bacterium]
MNYLVGLTGGIGSGKSTVAGLFADQGVRVIDTDLISHGLTQAGGTAIPLIRKEFGDRHIDTQGALDRGRMRQLVFADSAAKLKLEAILHPLILAQTRQQAAEPSKAPYTLIVVPLLFENGRYAGWMDRTIAVDCTQEAQLARTMQRSQLSEAEVRAILAHQLDRTERLALADEVIRNDGTLEDLKAQVVGMHRRLSALATESD